MHKAITIFLFLVTFMIAGYIFTQGVKIYKGGRLAAESQTQPAIDCIGYVYGVSGIKQQDGLAFRFENRQYSDKDVSKVTVRTDINQTAAFERPVPRGSSADITTELKAQINFTVYPDACAVYAKTCFLDGRECIGYEPPSLD
ncbi:hypothetical protein HYY74_05395 [Candidatus Woesearchaeota archaeon]|nr:hypothetical protein [Candidatus Woesearchaeota archaeon]